MASLCFDDLVTPVLSDLGGGCVQEVDLGLTEMLDAEGVQESLGFPAVF